MNSEKKTTTFPETRWSRIETAITQNIASEKALNELCEDYWYPLYGFLRNLGDSQEEAAEIVQDFLVMVIQKNHLKSVSPKKGKLRDFLMNSLMQFRKEKQRIQEMKVDFVSIDPNWAEGRFAVEPRDTGRTPEEAFDRRWAELVLERAFARVEKNFVKMGKGKEYQLIKPLIPWNSSEGNYESIAEKLDTTGGNVRVKVHRIRQQLREILELETRKGLHVGMGTNLVTELRILLGAR